MPKDKQIVNRRRTSLLRTAMVVAGFACLIHITHRECARMTDKPMKPSDAAAATSGPSSNISAGESFSATAYCLSGTTATGHRTRPGLVSADPEVIPLGSLIYVDSPLMGGIYQVLDTGELIKGKIIDIFIPSYERCVEFGRRIVKIKVLRYGFDDQPDPASQTPPAASRR